ncbi:MAG: hypothetical protein AAF821_21395 [Cyanobacteria bacterium P01_D01_bin.156]
MFPLLPPDDLPPETTTDIDAALAKQLEGALRQYFFETCDGSTQSLLMLCRWNITNAKAITLNIYCSDQEKNWRVLNRMTSLAEYLSRFSSQAKIRVHPPSDTDAPFDMRVDERSV